MERKFYDKPIIPFLLISISSVKEYFIKIISFDCQNYWSLLIFHCLKNKWLNIAF